MAMALFCAGTASAEDPGSYRSNLLRRTNSDYAKFCQAKASYDDCMVTQFFLDDIFAQSIAKDAAGKDICPSGAHINYAGGDDNAKEISIRCTVRS